MNNLNKGQNVKKRDFKLVGYLGIVLGLLFFAGAGFAFSITRLYPTMTFCFCLHEEHPYAQLAETMVATGIVLIILGLLSVGIAHYDATIQD